MTNAHHTDPGRGRGRRIRLAATAATLALSSGALAGGLTGPASATDLGAAPNLRYVAATSTLPAGTHVGTGALALCPSGTRPASGGASLAKASPSGLMGLGASGAVSSLGWQGSASQTSDTPATLRAFAVCVNSWVPSPQVQQSPPITPAWSTVVQSTVTCPDGTHAVGGGLRHSGTGGDFLLSSSAPYDGPDFDGDPDDGWKVKAYYLGSGGDTAYAQAVCMDGNSPTYRAGYTSIAPSSTGAVNAVCPGGQAVLGGGVSVSGSPIATRTLATRPWDSGDADSVPEDGWRSQVHNLTGVSRVLVTHAICR